MTTITISAVGDLMMGEKQIEFGRRPGDRFSFDHMFKEVAPFFQSADLMIGNLETTLSGREETYVRFQEVRKDWPMFNCPDELADVLKAAGFHVLTTANNHSLDRGPRGLKRTLDVLDERGFAHTGTYRSYEESQQDLIRDVKGVKVGILAFTYGTNLIPPPDDELWSVDFLQESLFDRVRALKRKADLTIVCLHYGIQYQTQPNERQRYWTRGCFENGADIVFGAHPHVLQPMETVRVRDVDGLEKNRFAFYSLGNFTTRRILSMKTIASAIARVTVTKDLTGRAEVTNADYVPTWFNPFRYSPRRYRVLPLEQRLNDGRPLRPKEREAMVKALDYIRGHLANPPASLHEG